MLGGSNMSKNLTWRGLVLALVLGLGLIYLLPTILSGGAEDGKARGGLSRILPSKVINLGLDLKGGIYLAMEIDLQVAVNNAVRRMSDELRRQLNENGVAGYRLQNENSPEITLETADAAQTYLLFWLLGDIKRADTYLSLFCKKSDTAKQYVEKWLSLVAASRLSKARPEEKEFLLHWANVVDYE
jgi:preprotein translocase subunit SecD